jgi:hypothetical protein
MPTVESCNEMLQHQDKIRLYLEKLRDMISQQHEHVAMMDQRMREHGGKGSGYYDDEMSMYGDDTKTQGYGGPESKKRRGVCSMISFMIRNKSNDCNRERPLLADATVATERRLLNGDGAQTGRELSATLVASTMQN